MKTIYDLTETDNSRNERAMFLLRMLKRLVFFVIFVVALFWAANYKIHGKPLYEVAKGFLTSGGYKEGMKDLRSFLGGFLKTMGEQIQEDVTDDEKKQLDKVIKKQLDNSGYKEIKK